MDTADDLALQQDQEEAQHSKYAPLRPSVPLGSECLVRVFFLDTLGTAQQLVLATTVPVERVQDRSVEIRQAVEAFLCTLGLQPLSIQLEVFTTKPMAFGHPAPSGKVLEFPVRRWVALYTAALQYRLGRGSGIGIRRASTIRLGPAYLPL